MIVGCDYSTKAVDLAQRDGERWHHVKLTTNGIDRTFIDELGKLLDVYAHWQADDDPERVLYVEQPWSRYNQATAMLMVSVATTVRVVAIQRGYRVEQAHVTAWRSRVFGKGKYSKDVAKLLAKDWAVRETGLAIVSTDDNAADACCIAAYGELRESE